MTDIVSVTRGSSPLVLSMPHPGTGLPAEVAAQLNARGQLVEDTDYELVRGAGSGDSTTIARVGTSTEIADGGELFYAEDYHQQYLHKVPNGYCGLGGTGVSCPIGVASAD